MESSGGVFYLVIQILVIVLGAALAYGLLRRRRRDRTGAVKRASDAAVRRNFDRDRR